MSSSRLAVRTLPALSLALGLVLGCASTPTPSPGPATPRTPTDTAVSRAPDASLPVLPAFTLRSGIHGYEFQQTTIVAVGIDSMSMIEDTLSTTALFTYDVRNAFDTLTIVGIVDSLSVMSSRDTSAMGRQLAAPVVLELEPAAASPPSLTMSPDSAPVMTTPEVPGGCDSMEAAARAIARDAYLRVPPGIQPGSRWTDSSTAALCRGGIPLTVTTMSAFEVQGPRTLPDSTIGQIIRHSTVTLSGSGLQGSRRITIAGTGRSETLFSYDLRAGTFLGSTGQSVLQLRFDTIQQTEEVLQRSSSRTRRRP